MEIKNRWGAELSKLPIHLNLVFHSGNRGNVYMVNLNAALTLANCCLLYGLSVRLIQNIKPLRSTFFYQATKFCHISSLLYELHSATTETASTDYYHLHLAILFMWFYSGVYKPASRQSFLYCATVVLFQRKHLATVHSWSLPLTLDMAWFISL